MRDETMENIKIALRVWLHVESEDSGVPEAEEDLVAI